MRRHRSGENWGLGGSGRTTISVIDNPSTEPPKDAVRVPFGFGPRDELRDDLADAEERVREAWAEVVEATRVRNEARARRRAEEIAARRARN